MSSPVRTVSAEDSALAASDRMADTHLQHLVVIEPEHGRVVGVISDRDLRAAQPSAYLIPDAAMRRKGLAAVRIREIMTAHPHVVRPEDTMDWALRAMLRKRVGSLVVVDRHEHAVGIITSGDVVKLALRLLEG